MKPRFGSRQHPRSRETHREADAVRHSTNALQIFRRVLPPHLLPQELLRYVLKDVKLQPLARAKMAPPLSRLPESLLFRPRSTRCLQQGHPKRCAPNHVAWLRQPAKVQNSLTLTVQLNLMPSVPLRRDHDHTGLDTPQNA